MHEETGSSNDTAAADALRAAATWLERRGADPEAIVLVRLAPHSAVGLWRAGDEHVGVLPAIDADGAALCSAAEPVAQALVAELPPDETHAVAAALAAGCRLELLLHPDEGTIALRLVHAGREPVFIAGVALQPTAH